MKMPEKHDLLAAILAAQNMYQQSLRLQWRTFAADIMAVRLQKNSNRRNDVRHYRPVYLWPSTSPTGEASAI